MNNIDITPEQAKAARDNLGLSQRFIAMETGINRSQLALFEVGKYNLEAYKRLALLHCYVRLGHRFDVEKTLAPSTTPSIQQTKAVQPIPNQKRKGSGEVRVDQSPRIIDGILIPSENINPGINSITTKVKNNDLLIDRLAIKPAKFSIWDDEPITKERDAIIRMMALNYLLIRRLQGRILFSERVGNSAKNRTTTPKTAADLVVDLLFPEIDQPDR